MSELKEIYAIEWMGPYDSIDEIECREGTEECFIYLITGRFYHNGPKGIRYVGITKRFLVMMDPETNVVYRMINPEITARSEDTCVMEEGCLSVLGPDGLPVYSNVRRPVSVDVKWTDENGKDLSAHMSGTAARIVQHETDHLNGVLFIDYLSGVKREMVMRKVNRGHK